MTAESRNEIFTHSSDARFRNGNKDCVSFLVTEKVSMLFERHRHCGNPSTSSRPLEWRTALFHSDHHHGGKDGEEQGRRGRGGEGREDGVGGEGYIDSGSSLVLSRFPVSGRPSQNVVL